MEICSVKFVYKCQVCGGLDFQGPYYYTSDSNLFDHLQFGVEQMVAHNKENIFEFSDTREGFFLDSSMVPKISFHKLLQFPRHDEILKYSWHECDYSGEFHDLFKGITGMAVLSGFRNHYHFRDYPRNSGFLNKILDLSVNCKTKEELFQKILEHKNS